MEYEGSVIMTKNQGFAEEDESTVITTECKGPTAKTKRVRNAFENKKGQYKEPRAVNRHRNQPIKSMSNSHDLNEFRTRSCN